MRAEAILFDKDGTLFDFYATWGSFTAHMIDGVTGGDAGRADRLADALGYDLVEGRFDPGSVVIAGTPAEIAEVAVEVLGRRPDGFVDWLNDQAAKAPQAEAVPLRPLLDRLRRGGLRLGVATNDGEAPARAHLGVAGVTDQFDFIAGFDSGHGGKPGPGMCLAFLKATGVAAERAVMVGDSLHDLHAGRAAGMQVVGVLTGIAREADLAPHADAVLPDIGHLPRWLGLLD